MACQQLIQQDSKGIDIRGICDRFSPHLFRARVFRRHWPPVRSGKRRVGEPLRVHYLGNTKIQEPGHALLGNQDVAGLQITMDDEGLMGILHREADRAEQPQALADRQPVNVAVFVDTNALDVIHDQIRQALFRASTVEQPHNVGVI